LGPLERRVMDVLWDAHGRSLSGRDVADELPDRAYTTVLTILERLRRKKLVVRTEEARVHTFHAAASREAYTATLMLESLGNARDRQAALVRFAENVTPEEAAILRRALKAANNPPR
jgi:predicted transcriptional regulator